MGKIFLVLWAVSLVSCQLSTKRDDSKNSDQKADTVSTEYSLAADRSALGKMREEIPEDRRQHNDELALILGDMAGEKRHPSKIRQKWSKAVRKRRSQFNKDMRKTRDTYNKSERKQRESFLSDQKKKRADFTKQKGIDREQRSEFYSRQDESRRNYFADERDKRKDFESQMREKRNTFNDYMRERQKTFEDEMRAYSKLFNMRRREESKAKKMEQKAKRLSRQRQTAHPKRGGIIQKATPPSKEAQSFLRELEEAHKAPAEPLGSGN